MKNTMADDNSYLYYNHRDSGTFAPSTFVPTFPSSQRLRYKPQNSFTALNADTDSQQQQQNGMTIFSKVAIPLMVVLFLFAIGICICALSSCSAEFMFWKENNKNEREQDDENKRFCSKGSRSLFNRHKSKNDRLSCREDNFNHPARRYDHNAPVDSISIRKNDTPSLEATLKDLSDTESKSFGNSSYAITRRQTFSNTPMGCNSNVGGDKFVPIAIPRSNSQPMIRLVESSLPSDTLDQSKDSVIQSKVDYVKRVEEPLVSSMLPMTMRFFPSFFKNKNDNRKESSVTNVVKSLTKCQGSNDKQCLNGVNEEMPARENKSYVLNYLPESSRPPIQQPDRMSKKKSDAYREYIHKKNSQRIYSLEDSSHYDDNSRMEIGLKRSFVDERGTIREMVAL